MSVFKIHNLPNVCLFIYHDLLLQRSVTFLSTHMYKKQVFYMYKVLAESSILDLCQPLTQFLFDLLANSKFRPDKKH